MKYSHLFFDLDGTLWDLHRNAHQALTDLTNEHREGTLSGLDFPTFFSAYQHHNEAVWALYRVGKIEKELLRTVRFERAFRDAGMEVDEPFIQRFADDFLDRCPKLPHLVPGARDLLDHVHGRYTLHIITNGFKEVQGFKMEAGGLFPYFSEIINSEDAGYRKPHPAIFEHALQRAGATKEESLMIGDDWDADILGARDAGIDQVFLINGEGRHNHTPTYAVHRLDELIGIL